MNRNSLRANVSQSPALIKIMHQLKEMLQKITGKNRVSNVKIERSFVEGLNYIYEDDDLKWDEYGNPYI